VFKIRFPAPTTLAGKKYLLEEMSPAYTIKRRKKRFRTKLGTSGYLTENSETNLKYT